EREPFSSSEGPIGLYEHHQTYAHRPELSVIEAEALGAAQRKTAPLHLHHTAGSIAYVYGARHGSKTKADTVLLRGAKNRLLAETVLWKGGSAYGLPRPDSHWTRPSIDGCTHCGS